MSSDKKIEPVCAVKIFDRKIWIEEDFFGNKHVMVQHEGHDSEPFCYCTFNYSYAHTSNSTIRNEAILMAMRIGAKEPVEIRFRKLDLEKDKDKKGRFNELNKDS